MTSTQNPRPSLSLAMHGLLPVVETKPERMLAMADALLWWGNKATELGHAAQGTRYVRRAEHLRRVATLPDLFADDGGVPSPCEPTYGGPCACGSH